MVMELRHQVQTPRRIGVRCGLTWVSTSINIASTHPVMWVPHLLEPMSYVSSILSSLIRTHVAVGP